MKNGQGSVGRSCAEVVLKTAVASVAASAVYVTLSAAYLLVPAFYRRNS